ncbi:SDR family NAD(P)-dependent oxidoreductase, partial [Streptomyces sp. NPDC005409]|uniref:SDR family NAD(P)-dependent oxidoreductase n=1 Tax=Streptomyces sp. NPDC005409 TaxID=3155342 RepID=UPI00345594B7
SPQGVEHTAAAPPDPSPRSAPEETPRRAPGPAGTTPAPAAPTPRTAEQLMEAVLELVHTRTGYPRDMLDPALDLEADLSIDSIKRVEIIGALADRIGLPRDPGGSTESAVEELSRIKTLRGIVDWLTTHTPAATAPAAPSDLGPDPTAPPAPPAPPVTRLRVDTLPAPLPAPDPRDLPHPPGLRSLRIGIVDDGQALAPALLAALDAQGAEAKLLPAPEPGFDGIVDLTALRPGSEPVLPDAFPGLRRTLTSGTHRLLLVTAPGTPSAGVQGAGLHGFARSAALEFPGTLIRAVQIQPKEAPEQLAAQLLAELSHDSPDGPASVGYTPEGTRTTRTPVPAPLTRRAAGEPPLDRDAVVLLTGGARGITARTAVALARATGCHIELIGRTPEPPAAADDFAQAHDRVALRAALIAAGLRTPAEIEATASRILAGREVRATLSALATAAASVRYHCADVTDEGAVRAVVADVRARHGRLDGIVHGAGILRDGLLSDKQPADFSEVFTTKVAGARHLAAAAAEHGPAPAPRFLALFGSVAGVYGNRGQSDYAAANDALDALAHTWAESFLGRVLSVDWGPWAAQSGGMVTPELERAYARRGIPLIAPEAGTAAFLDELAHGTDVQVVLMAQEGGGDE